jgi:hypothetical protein
VSEIRSAGVPPAFRPHSETQPVAVVWTILGTGLKVAGGVLVLAGLLLGPIIGLIAVVMLFTGTICFHLGSRIKAGAS